MSELLHLCGCSLLSMEKKRKKEWRRKGTSEGQEKKEGLCSPLERRADVDVDVKEGGEKNESKARQKQAKAKSKNLSPSDFCSVAQSWAWESSSFPHALQREMKAVKL